MAWEIDPDFALQTRLSFGRRAAIGVGMGVAVQTAALLAPAVRAAVAPVLAAAAIAALTIALPYAAVRILSMERDGKLDQQRLSGRSDLRLAAVLLVGSCWPFLVEAIPGATVIGTLGLGPVSIAAILLAAVATTLAMLAAARAALIDSWMLLALGIMIAMLVTGAVALTRWASLAAIAVSAVIVVATLPRVVRRLRRPPRLEPPRTHNLLRPIAGLRTTSLPEFSRAVITAGGSGLQSLVLPVAAPLLVGLLGYVSHPVVRVAFEALLVYVPLGIAGFQCSASARAENLAILRLTVQRPWSAVLQLGTGFAAPYIGMSIAAALALALIRPAEALPFLWPWPAAAALFTMVGVAEGFGRRRLGVYFATVVPLLLLAPYSLGDVAILACVALWVPVAVAAGRLKNPEAAPCRGTAAVAAAGGTGVVVVFYMQHTNWPLSLVAGALSLGAGMLVPDRRPGYGAGLRGACAVAAAAGAGISEFFLFGVNQTWTVFGPWPRLAVPIPTGAITLLFAVIPGLFAAAGLQFGWLAHNVFGSSNVRSRIWRALPAVAMIAMMLGMDADLLGGPLQRAGRRVGWSRYVIAELGLLAILAAAIVILMTIELARERAGRLTSRA